VWGAGHFLPLVPFLDQARLGGGQTLVVGPPSAEGMVRATGHPFLAGREPVRPDEASGVDNRMQFGRMAALALLGVMERAVSDWRPDVILREPFEYASAEAAVRLGVPAAQVAHGLAGRMWEGVEGVAPDLEAFRDGLAGELCRSPFLTRLPASLDASPFPATRRYRLPAAAPRGALPAWWAGDGAPLVYVSFGTVVGRMPVSGEIYRAVIDAVAGLDARVLVTVGRDFDISQLHDVPGNVHVEAWVDQADVLGEAGLMVCHGGSGTVYDALASGVPLVVMPMFADQFANATVVANVGAGIQVLPRRDAQGRRHPASRDDVPRIRQVIETVLGDGSYRQAAQAVAAEMAAAPAIETVLGQLPRRR
jgi:UDP:flavonoid glycosyltransferase YjiC (YdhE family)